MAEIPAEIPDKVGPLIEVMAARRTIRTFRRDELPAEDIRQIIEAGMMAPYPILGTSASESFRKFFVLRQGGAARKEVEAVIQRYADRITRLLQNRFAQTLVRLADSLVVGHLRSAKQYSQANDLLNQHVDNTGHFAHIGDAPYLVVVAEQSRGPLLASYLIRQSLGHCMQNMWLVATAKGLAFQPISVSKVLAGNRRACAALGIQRHRYEIDGFLIGYPSKPPPRKVRHGNLDEDITWS